MGNQFTLGPTVQATLVVIGMTFTCILYTNTFRSYRGSWVQWIYHVDSHNQNLASFFWVLLACMFKSMEYLPF